MLGDFLWREYVIKKRGLHVYGDSLDFAGNCKRIATMKTTLKKTIQDDIEDDIAEPVPLLVRKRLPWLLLGLI